ncbi:helix-turn-helix transcriptional regulator [Frankia sp. Cppng1_Ct_nod]|uniref:helix-turn-helix domain-containing protein n=1 Tax=Frankia sp. Cppng1_Ct_nod TaxID=2897162 RepID=UPI0032EA05CA
MDIAEPACLAAGLLSLARQQVGLTQTELAHRAGVQQSVVSAYEAGRRQPTVPMLLRLIRATGNDVQFRLAGADETIRVAPATVPADRAATSIC